MATRILTLTSYAPPLNAESGTWHDTGDKILKAVADQQRRALDGALADSWRRRTDKQVGIALAAALAGRDAPLVANI